MAIQPPKSHTDITPGIIIFKSQTPSLYHASLPPIFSSPPPFPLHPSSLLLLKFIYPHSSNNLDVPRARHLKATPLTSIRTNPRTNTPSPIPSRISSETHLPIPQLADVFLVRHTEFVILRGVFSPVLFLILRLPRRCRFLVRFLAAVAPKSAQAQSRSR